MSDDQRFVAGGPPAGWKGREPVANQDGSTSYLSWREASLRLDNREKFAKRSHTNTRGYVYYIVPMSEGDIEREIAETEEALAEHEAAQKRADERATEQMHEQNRRLREGAADADGSGGAPPGPRGFGQTAADLQAQIDPYTSIPLVGSEEAVFQGGAGIRGRVGPKLPRIPGVKPPNERTARFIGQSCRDEGDIPLTSWSKDLLKHLGISVGPTANVCVNANQAVKKAAGETAEAIKDLVEPVGDKMNQGRIDRIEDALRRDGG